MIGVEPINDEEISSRRDSPINGDRLCAVMPSMWMYVLSALCVVLNIHAQTRKPSPAPASSARDFRSVIEIIGVEATRLRSAASYGLHRPANEVVDDLAANHLRWFVRLPKDPLDAAEQRLRNKHYLKIGELFNQFSSIGGRLGGVFAYPAGDVPVRFGLATDGGIALIITGLASDQVYNTLRMDTNERASATLRRYVLPSIQKFDTVLGPERAFDHYGLVVAFRSVDFLTANSGADEMLAVIASARSCHQFVQAELSDVDFLKIAEVYLLDRDAIQIRRTKITLK